MKNSKWTKVRVAVLRKPPPPTAWSRVDMALLFPDLYKSRTALQPTMLGSDENQTLSAEDNKIKSQRQIYIASQSMGLYAVQILSTPNNMIALGFGNGNVNLHNSKTCKRISTIQVSAESMPVTCIREYHGSSRHNLVTGAADGFLKSYEIKPEDDQDPPIEVLAANMEVPVYSVDTSENWHVCALSNKLIKVIDALTGEFIRCVGAKSDADEVDTGEGDQCVGHTSRITCVRFHPEQKYICASGGWDRSVHLWDIRQEGKSPVRTLKGPKIYGDGMDILGDKCLTASFFTDDALQLWDLGSGKLIETIKYKSADNDPEYLYCCKFVDANRVVAGGSGNNDAKLINIKDRRIEGIIKDVKPIHTMGYKNNILAAGGVSCYVTTGDLPPDIQLPLKA